jgi:hypothetical protein
LGTQTRGELTGAVYTVANDTIEAFKSDLGANTVASYAPMESAAPSVRTSPRVIMPPSLRR